MGSRKPAVAGQFYDGSKEGCLAEIKNCLAEWEITEPLPDTILAGIVPHAGWVFSGDLAGAVFSAIKNVNKQVDTFVIFGAAHRYIGNGAIIYDSGSWQTPLGEIEIDEEFAAAIVKTNFAQPDKSVHAHEHSIEVQLPFIQHLFPAAKIVPIMVPPLSIATDLGEEVADLIKDETDKKIVCIASSDLTHYGPRYGFAPEGIGPDAIQWAKEVNDMQFINYALAMQASELLLCAEENASACGPGAVAALVALAKRLGKKEGKLIGHTHSCDVMKRKFNESSEESVGYAGIVY